MTEPRKDDQRRAAIRAVIAACVHVWHADTKRPRWQRCARCRAVRDPSRGIAPWIWFYQ